MGGKKSFLKATPAEADQCLHSAHEIAHAAGGIAVHDLVPFIFDPQEEIELGLMLEPFIRNKFHSSTINRLRSHKRNWGNDK